MVTLRSYQIESMGETLNRVKTEATNRQCLMLPTGSGKSVIAAQILQGLYEGGKRAAFIVPRTALVDQFSAHLESFGIPHGVTQGDHWRYLPHERIQICSAQTLSRRGFPEGLDTVVIDEAHLKYKKVNDFIIKDRAIKVIGLTATPFAKGMDETYDGVVCKVTQNQLIEQGHLVPLKIFCGVSADMAKILVKSTGEWDDAAMAAAQSELVGDLFTEWQDKTLKYFKGPTKTIAFGPTVEYCETLKKVFAKNGIRFEVVSYRDDKDARKELFTEFKKPDSEIMGLISCEALREGFDVPDVNVVIDAHPYRKSRQAVIQMHGRCMRPFPGKKFGLLLDHAGNYLRHHKFLEKIAAQGFDALKGGLKANEEAFKPEKEEEVAKKIKERKCPQCNTILKLFTDGCSECGWIRPVVPKVIQAAGKMLSFDDIKKGMKDGQKKLSKTERTKENKEFVSHIDAMPPMQLLGELKGYAIAKWGDDPERATKWINANFRSRRGTWAPVKVEHAQAIQPSAALLGDIDAKRKLWAVTQKFKRPY